MKTFKEHLLESGTFTEMEIQMLNENLKSELTVEEEAKVDKAIKDFCAEYMDKKSINEELTNEGFLGSIFGGLTGFALGSSIGKIIANVLGIEKGVVFDLLTSRLVGAALGAAIGKRM
jgi:hypothetical protein